MKMHCPAVACQLRKLSPHRVKFETDLRDKQPRLTFVLPLA